VAGDEELLERMRRHPVGWRYAELSRILRRSGFAETRRRGSHRTWRHPCGINITVVDRPGEVQAVYVQQVVAAVARAREAE
jgi:predicted RNA binding protein YcfA (HicA-like mRNA interferase family)